MSDIFRAHIVKEQALLLKNKYIKSCSRCNGNGRILTNEYDIRTFSYKTFPCRCYRKYIYVLDMILSGVSETEALEAIYKKNIKDTKVLEIELSNNKANKTKLLYKDYLNKYISSYKEVIKEGYSFIFVGTNGNGKTFASLRILHKILKMGHTGHYIKFRKLMKIINSSITGRNEDATNSSKLLSEITMVDFLIIDELGRETGNREHISGEVDELLKNRSASCKSTILITNREFEDIEDLYHGGNSSIVSSMMINYKLLVFDPDKDYRRVFRKKEWYHNE